MSQMNNSTENDNQNGKSVFPIVNAIKDFWELFASISAAVAAVVTAILGTSRSTQVIASIIAGLCIGIGLYAHRNARKRQKIRQRRDSLRHFWEKIEAKNTAFRGLYSYEEGDTLPGEHRQLEASILVTQLTHPQFRFGIVCGDVGCGKTSFLKCAVQKLLHEKGWTVLYFSNPNALNAKLFSSPVTDLANADFLSMISSYADAPAQSIGSNCVVVIDQFEELFFAYSEQTQRLSIGANLNAILGPTLRVVCAVRRDSLIDFQDLSPSLPNPLSTKNIFHIRNFTIEQASAVIEECAALDNIEIVDSLPKTLASDLAEGQFVRPPELQIVCTALRDGLSLPTYYHLGGASGILSHYIEDALAICADPNLGRLLLRTLCDFPAHAKKPPQSLESLVSETGQSKTNVTPILGSILQQFETGRLVVSDHRSEKTRHYSLVHDYLVDAVALATKGELCSKVGDERMRKVAYS